MKMKAVEANAAKSSCPRKPSDQKQGLEYSGVLGELRSKPGLLLRSVTVRWMPACSRRKTSSGHRSKNTGKHLPLGRKFSHLFSVRRALKDLLLDVSDETSEIQKMFSSDFSSTAALTACGKAHTATVFLSGDAVTVCLWLPVLPTRPPFSVLQFRIFQEVFSYF